MFGGEFGVVDVLIIVGVVLLLIAAGLYFLNRWASKRVSGQQSMIEKTKQPASIYVIDKKHDKAENVTLPKVVTENLPKMSKVVKMHFVKAKVGPQIVTLMCDKHIFNNISLKKTYNVELAGIYIVSVKGLKSKFEQKEAVKAKRLKVKAESKKSK